MTAPAGHRQDRDKEPGQGRGDEQGQSSVSPVTRCPPSSQLLRAAPDALIPSAVFNTHPGMRWEEQEKGNGHQNCVKHGSAPSSHTKEPFPFMSQPQLAGENLWDNRLHLTLLIQLFSPVFPPQKNGMNAGYRVTNSRGFV